MSRSALQTLAGLRRVEERQRRVELASCLATTATAKSALGGPPLPAAATGAVSQAAFLAGRAEAHMAWAAWGARLARVETAAAAETEARAAWKAASADLRAVERLLSRRAHLARAEAARRAQRDLDEVATTRWLAQQ